MELPGTLQEKIIDFLKSLPNIGDTNSRKAFINSAGLEPELQNQIPVDEPPAQFIPLLVSQLLSYGKLNDGRYPLKAILGAAKNYIGQDNREYCDTLLREFDEYVATNLTFSQSQQQIDKAKNLHESNENIPERDTNFDYGFDRLFKAMKNAARGSNVRRSEGNHFPSIKGTESNIKVLDTKKDTVVIRFVSRQFGTESKLEIPLDVPFIDLVSEIINTFGLPVRFENGRRVPWEAYMLDNEIEIPVSMNMTARENGIKSGDCVGMFVHMIGG